MDGEVDIYSECMVDKEAVEREKEESQRFQLVSGDHQDGTLSKHPNSLHATNAEEYGKENNVKDVTAKLGNAHKDGLQEHVILAEELQSEEARKCEGEAEVTTIAIGNINQTYIQEQQSDMLPEGRDSSKAGQEETNSMVPEVDEAVSGSGSALSKSEKADTDVDKKVTAPQKQKSKNSQISNSHAKSARRLPASNISFPRTANPRSLRTNYTVPQPFALATDKRASNGVRPTDGEIAGITDRHTIANNITSASVLKKPQLVAKTASAPLCRKSFPSESLKLEDQNVKPSLQEKTNHDDEDNCSVASSTSPRKTIEEKPRSAASGPSLRCDDRAKKRKDFYSKLEERIHAKEMEKSELQLKSKVKQEAEIKQLRKNMTFKATPMPHFYHEAATPKVELKKIPPTRAKSPKLGRRNSCVGVESEGDYGQSSTSSCSSLNKNKSNGAEQDLTEDENKLRKSLNKVPSAEHLLKSKLDEMPISPKQQDLNGLETKSAKGLTENDNFTRSSVSNNSTNASDDEIVSLQGSQAVKEQDNSEPLIGHNEIAESMVNKNQTRESDEERLIVHETEAVREKERSVPFDGQNEIVNNNKQRESYEDAINLQESKAVKEMDDNEILNGHNEVVEVKINQDKLGKSASLVATVKATANGNGKLADDVQGSDTSKSKRNGSKVSLGSKVHKKEKIQCNDAGLSCTKSKSVRSSQEGSVQELLETNGKGNQNVGRSRPKVMTTSITSSKREDVKSASSKETGKGCNGMTQVVGDVLVQS